MNNLYPLTKGDKEIFKLSDKDPNIWTDYYLRSETSGTWWFPGAKTERWSKGYERLLSEWRSLKRPNDFSHSGNMYRVVMDHEKSEEFPRHPAFFHNHGLLFLPWAKHLHNDRTPIRTIIGGFGSGKTLNLALSKVVQANKLAGYRCLVLAPYSVQVMEVYKLILDMIDGTKLKERFFIGAPKKPFPQIIFGNNETGQTTIEFYPILNNSEKIRTISCDTVMIDQAEKIDDLEAVLRDVGTRMRGRLPKTGRSRVGTLDFIANSEDNQELWDLYDMAAEDPKRYLAMSPSSYDNVYLTDADLMRFEMQVGGSKELKRQYLFGERPLGNGEHFSRMTLEMMQDESLDRLMDQGMEENLPGYIRMEARNVGYHEWFLPPLPGRKYLVISDPGTANPPERDSPVIMVWDITEFPGKAEDRKPAKLVGFAWVFGNRNIKVWATRYAEIVNAYKAVGSNAFDATGFQSGYDQWMSILTGLLPEKINLAGNGKYMCLNSAKILSTNAMFRIPKSLTMVFAQLSRYETPEPKRLRQDIAVTVMMTAFWLMRLYFFTDMDEVTPTRRHPHERNSRPLQSRYSGRPGSR